MQEPATSAKIVGPTEVSNLHAAACANPRGRSHLLLHAGHGDQVQRLVILGEPTTYVRPHLHSEQWEVLACLAGRADLLLYESDGRLHSRIRLGPDEAHLVEIPVGVAHSLIVREPKTLILEIKPGPYRPNEFVAWAPEEGDRQVTAFSAWVSFAALGEAWRPSAAT